MSTAFKLAIPLGLGAAFVAYLVYSSLLLSQATCEVCVAFNGQTDCRTAAGTSAEEAAKTAQDNACALLSNGRDESISCSAVMPQSVMCVAE